MDAVCFAYERGALLQNLNSYSYAIDNPVNKSDPLGKHVELVSRPIGDWNGVPVSQLGAHAFVFVVPDSPGTIGKINGVDTTRLQDTVSAVKGSPPQLRVDAPA